MQAPAEKYTLLVRAIAPSGNLFLVLTLPELRRQGLTFIAFYALQRSIEEQQCSEAMLRAETGLPHYEISRACGFLAESGLIEKSKSEFDGRIRMLRSTPRGVMVRDKVLSASAKRLEGAVNGVGHRRQISEATDFFRKANRTLLGRRQLSFFDIQEFHEDQSRLAKKKKPGAKTLPVVP